MPLWAQSGQTVPREGRDRYSVALQAGLVFHAKMGTIKDRKGMDLTEAEDVKKRWQEELYKYTEELYQKTKKCSQPR